MSIRQDEAAISDPGSVAGSGELLLPAAPRQPAKRNPWRILAAALIIVFGICSVAWLYSIGLTDEKVTEKDFIQYWVIGHQLIHGVNPYDIHAVLSLEQTVGLIGNEPRVSLSPPVAFFFFVPLAFVSPKIGFILWWWILIACLMAALRLLWVLNGRPDNRFHLVGYVFAPVLVCLMAGQLSIFLLLGIVLFLYLHKSRPGLAGAALLPCALKPQLFLVFAVVLLVWVVSRKAYRVLAGFVAALLGSCGLTLLFDNQVWSQYFRLMHDTSMLQQFFIPTFGVVLRFLIDRDAVGLQYIPAVVGCVWAVWYFWTRRNRWDWMDQGLFLLFISDVCAPYGFFTDECILLPFILAGLYRARNLDRAFILLMVINGAALIEVLTKVNIISPYYLWTTPAWLGWYLYATGSIGGWAEGVRVESEIAEQARV